MNRRGFLRGGAVTAAGVMGGAWLGSCTDSEETGAAGPAGPTDARVLIAYFSRAGENYHYGGRR